MPADIKMFYYASLHFLDEVSRNSGAWIIYFWVYFYYQTLLGPFEGSIVKPNQFHFFKGHPGNGSIHF